MSVYLGYIVVLLRQGVPHRLGVQQGGVGGGDKTRNKNLAWSGDNTKQTQGLGWRWNTKQTQGLGWRQNLFTLLVPSLWYRSVGKVTKSGIPFRVTPWRHCNECASDACTLCPDHQLIPNLCVCSCARTITYRCIYLKLFRCLRRLWLAQNCRLRLTQNCHLPAYAQGAGSMLLEKPARMEQIVRASAPLLSCALTLKTRMVGRRAN